VLTKRRRVLRGQRRTWSDLRLATFIPHGCADSRAGEVRDGHVVPFVDEHLTVLDVLNSKSAALTAEGPSWALEDVTFLAPLNPRAIFGIGMNYSDQFADTRKERPERPLLFTKLPSSAVPPNAPVQCPAVVERLDYEGELAVVMGVEGTVAGYAVANDVSARDLQADEAQWTRAKGADGFCPFGPWITTVDEVRDPHALNLRTWVNGQLRQDSNTSNLIFTIPQIVAFISETCTMEPGDLVLTGTPAGVGVALDPPCFLSSGDIVRIEIERIGAIEHAIV
jgi:acylpyruvate hydrolase